MTNQFIAKFNETNINALVDQVSKEIKAHDTQAPQTKVEKFVGGMSNFGRRNVSNLEGCGKVSVNAGTLYRIAKTNKMAGAYIDKISDMVAAEGFCVVDPNTKELRDDSSAEGAVQEAVRFFRTGVTDNLSNDNFIRDFFVQYFCSGEVTLIPNKINLINRAPKDGYVKILDTRGLKKFFDDFGEIKHYHYVSGKKIEKYLPKQVTNMVLLRDPNNPMSGYSKLQRIVIEALTNQEANARQLYFFKNNAVPNVLVALNQERIQSAEDVRAFAEMWNNKFKGSANTHKPLISDVVENVTTLDVSNVDMDYLNLRKENDKDFAVVFLLDTRLVGLQKDTGAFSEVESMTVRQGNSTIETYGKLLSDSMTVAYKKFVDPKFDGEFKCKNAEFKDVTKQREISMQEVDRGIITRNEYRTEFNLEEMPDEFLDSFTPTKQGNAPKEQPVTS